MRRLPFLRYILLLLCTGLAQAALAEPLPTRSAHTGMLACDALLTEPSTSASNFVVLSYHEVRDDVRDYPDPYAVDSAALLQQFAWLRGNGYVPISLDDIITARRGGRALPERAVLLTFDDAYLSFYTRVYPLLREFGYPAVLAVVGRWIDMPAGTAVPYGEKATVLEASFPSWAMLREMANSGLVELASHTYDLHRGIPANPQGNLQPAATARLFDKVSGNYESDAAWRTRVSADLSRSAAVIERNTGKRPRAIVWPYGSYNQALMDIAAESGMSIGLTLDDGMNTPEVHLSALRRVLVEHDPALAEFAAEVRGPRNRDPMRVVEVSLDDIYSSDPVVQESNLSALLDHIETLKPTHVFLQATSDLDKDGRADAAYFPNHSLPLRGDVFNRAAWQLASRADVKVFAVMPLAGNQLSPDKLLALYEDLGRHANIDGLVIDDSLSADSATEATLARQLAVRVGAFRMPLPLVRQLRVAQLADVATDLPEWLATYHYVALVSPSAEAVLPAMTPVRDKVIVMLPREAASSDRQQHMRALQLSGALHFGYFATGALHDDAARSTWAPAMSLRLYPQRMKAKD